MKSPEMKKLMKRKLWFLPLPIWVVIAILVAVGGLVGAYVFAEVTSESQVAEPLSVTDKVDFDENIWPCYSSYLTFNVHNDAPVAYGLKLTPETFTFPAGVHFGEVLVGGAPYVWGETVDIPAYGTVAVSIEVVADCDAAEGPVAVTINVDRVAPGAPPEIYDLTVGSTAGGSVTDPGEPGPFPYSAGTVVNLLADPDPGYGFDAWTGDVGTVGSTSAASTTITMWGDYSITANFEEVVTHTLTMQVSGNGSTTPAVGAHPYDEGTVVPITANPDSGWVFDSWTGDVADPNSASTTVTMDSDKTVTANFTEEAITYDLTMAVSGNGSTTPAVGDHPYAAGTVVPITADPDSGWVFDSWTGDVADPNSASTTVTMNSDKTVTANFTEEVVTYTLTMQVSGNGSTTPAVGAHPYDEGTVVPITANPDSGWVFDSWTGDVADPNSASTTVTMNSDKTVTANFTEEVVLPPIPDVSTELHYLVDMSSPSFGLNEVDHPFDVHIAAHDVLPEETDCAPCTDPSPAGPCGGEPGNFPPPPAVPSYHLEINTNPGGNIYAAPQRPMALFGYNMKMQLYDADIYQSMSDLTDVFEIYYTYPPVFNTYTKWEYASVDHAGTQPGWPYSPVPNETWSNYWMFGGFVYFPGTFEGCVPPMPFFVECHVEGYDNIAVPAGTFDVVHIVCTYTFMYFDDDGDTLIDEDWLDGFDNDGDTLVDEDQIGVDNDGDGLWNEDPENTVDDDGDTLVDEDAAEGAPPPNGNREIWYAPDIGASGAMVRQININTPFIGTETWELSSIGP